MRSLNFILILSLFTILLSCSGQAEDSLKYITNAFVKITTEEGKVIYIDPALVNEFSDSADIVLITHEHSDHNEISRVLRKDTCIVIRPAQALTGGVYQSFTFGNITITSVPAFNGYHNKNNCVGYVIEIGAVKIYHAGDTGKIDEMADLADQDITFALLPMDGTYTMTPGAATEAALMINADFDIPIHTMPGITGYNDQVFERFTSPHKLFILPGNSIALNITASINDQAVLPGTIKLFQNYPNPFNPSTTISYSLEKRERVLVKVYDILGNEVKTLVNRDEDAGIHEIIFDSNNLVSGIYFYTLETSGFSKTCKMIILK